MVWHFSDLFFPNYRDIFLVYEEMLLAYDFWRHILSFWIFKPLNVPPTFELLYCNVIPWFRKFFRICETSNLACSTTTAGLFLMDLSVRYALLECLSFLYFIPGEARSSYRRYGIALFSCLSECGSECLYATLKIRRSTISSCRLWCAGGVILRAKAITSRIGTLQQQLKSRLYRLLTYVYGFLLVPSFELWHVLFHLRMISGSRVRIYREWYVGNSI